MEHSEGGCDRVYHTLIYDHKSSCLISTAVCSQRFCEGGIEPPLHTTRLPRATGQFGYSTITDTPRQNYPSSQAPGSAQIANRVHGPRHNSSFLPLASGIAISKHRTIAQVRHHDDQLLARENGENSRPKLPRMGSSMTRRWASHTTARTFVWRELTRNGQRFGKIGSHCVDMCGIKTELRMRKSRSMVHDDS